MGKRLKDEPDCRSMHTNKTPTFRSSPVFFSVEMMKTIIGTILYTKKVLIMGGFWYVKRPLISSNHNNI